MSNSTFTYRLDGHVSRIAFNDPATLNAISPEAASELSALLLRAEREARCVILTGEGRAFCSGARLSGAMAPSDGSLPDVGQSLETSYNPLILTMRDLSIPIVSGVNGAAAGIGSSLALMGDIVIASETAYFLQAFINIGLVPDGGATWMLPRFIGKARAMELALLGDRLPAAKALEWGLVNDVVPGEALESRIHQVAERLATGATRAISMTRKLIWSGLGSEFSDQLDSERQLQRDAGHTQDFVEGVSAFAQKRRPNFIGK